MVVRLRHHDISPFVNLDLTKKNLQIIYHTLTRSNFLQKGGVMTRVRRTTKQTNPPSRLLNREQSWIEFNARVLEEALDPQTPLLERVKFLAIVSTNMDEFFMIRVAGLHQQRRAGVQTTSPDGLSPSEQLTAIRKAVHTQLNQQRQCWQDDVTPKLREQGIWLLDYHELGETQRQQMDEYFVNQIQPVLTPLAFDASHPFPLISNLSLNLAVVIGNEQSERFVRVKVPAVLPRLIPITPNAEQTPAGLTSAQCSCFVWIEQIIAANLYRLFPTETIQEVHPFRITRNADFEIEEDEADDLLQAIEENIRQRRFGAVVRLAIQPGMPARLRQLLLQNLNLDPDELYEIRGQLGLSVLMQLLKLNRPDLKDEPDVPRIPAPFRDLAQPQALWDVLRQRDVLLHHPYDSFQPVIDFIETAATDPNVLAIKQTLYRVGNNSPIVRALMHARDLDKQVTVLVELKARFDEENNITWARALERAGVHVVYGVPNLKTHAKMAMVVRREGDLLRRYVHVGTGNYNAGTARVYTDLGLMTSNPDITADVADVFNYLTGYAKHDQYRALLVAPVNLRTGLSALIEREITHAQAGIPAYIIFKANSLVDQRIIELLYRAAQAGVEIDLIIRGMCALRPDMPGVSERIRVRSIIGRYLEHSRIYWFANNQQPQVYVGSADIMERNLDRRVETLFPILDQQISTWIREKMLDACLRDTARTRILRYDGSWARQQITDVVFDSQRFFRSLVTME
jgi:polyphosphate kinase